MDIISAYQQAGSYRGAAEICGTTHKTVRRVIERAEAGGTRPVRQEREHNYAPVQELVTARVVALGRACMRPPITTDSPA